jgi:hypothetical protein
LGQIPSFDQRFSPLCLGLNDVDDVTQVDDIGGDRGGVRAIVGIIAITDISQLLYPLQVAALPAAIVKKGCLWG